MKNLPTIVALGYNAFLGLFALDVFSEGLSIAEMMVGLVMHLVPNMVLLVVTILGYKKPLVGSLVFGGLVVVFTLFFRTYTDPIVWLLISGPLLVIAGLYGWSWRYGLKND